MSDDEISKLTEVLCLSITSLNTMFSKAEDSHIVFIEKYKEAKSKFKEYFPESTDEEFENAYGNSRLTLARLHRVDPMTYYHTAAEWKPLFDDKKE
jgi:hypothetical protein